MKNYSLWQEINTKKLKSLDKSLTCDVLIIGGGITGLSILYNLENTNLNTILVERNTCGYGVTSKSTAKITYLQDDIYVKIAKYNKAISAKYLKSQIDATKMLASIIKKENIDCNLERSSSYVFTNEQKKVKNIEKLYNFLKTNGIKVETSKKDELNEESLISIKVGDTYVFHPLKYINHLKMKFKNQIYENSKVESIQKEDDFYNVKIGMHTIKTQKIIFATHYPYFLLPFVLPLKSHIEVSYMGAKEINKYKPINAINIDKSTISFRYHRTPDKNYFIKIDTSYKTNKHKNTKKVFKELNNNLKYDYIWSNNDIITSDYIPYIGSISKDSSLLIATGYNTWGMTNGTLAGSIIKDILMGVENPYIEVFDPKRRINANKIINFPLNMSSNIINYLKSTKNNQNNKNVIYTKIDNEKVAIYTDKNGTKHIVKNRCPHMKCGLILNEIEGTWDCMCHGSRYTLDGKCIEGPSNEDITYKIKRDTN